MTWSVLQTFSGASDGSYDASTPTPKLPLALRHLTWNKIEWFNPRFSSRVRSGRGVVQRPAQLFRDYVFVRPGTRWRDVNETEGVVGLLMSEPERPAVISDDRIESLRLRIGDDGLVQLSKSKFTMGQRVQVKTGPAAWEVGIYDGQRNRDRVYVLMSWLGTQRRVEIQEDNLVAA